MKRYLPNILLVALALLPFATKMPSWWGWLVVALNLLYILHTLVRLWRYHQEVTRFEKFVEFVAAMERLGFTPQSFAPDEEASEK